MGGRDARCISDRNLHGKPNLRTSFAQPAYQISVRLASTPSSFKVGVYLVTVEHLIKGDLRHSPNMRWILVRLASTSPSFNPTSILVMF